MVPFFLILVYMCVPYFLYSLLFSFLYRAYSTNKSMKKIALKLGQELPFKYKILTSFCLGVLAIIGIWQTVEYYVFSGANLWFIIISTELVFIYFTPIGLMVSPFIKFNSNDQNHFKKLYCNFVGSFTFMWGIFLLVDKNMDIYSGGDGNVLLKVLGGISLIILGLYGLITTSVKYSISLKKDEIENATLNRIGFSIMESLTKKINHRQENNLYRRNRPLFIALVPLITLTIIVIVFLLFSDLVIILILFINLVPFTILFIIVLLLRQVWISKRVNTIIKKIGAIVLTMIWLGIFVVLNIFATANWDSYIKTNNVYLLVDILFILANSFSLIWTWIDMTKKNKE